MKINQINQWLRAALCILSIACFGINPVAAAQIDKVIVFGDSLSDNGNLYNLTTAASQYLPYIKPLPINPPYYEGRFCNGRIWPEFLAESMNVPLSDHAYGGAWAESGWYSGFVVPFDLATQVYFYLRYDEYSTNNDNHLYVIWMGANDYVQGRTDVDTAVKTSITAIGDQVERLIVNGAKYIMLLTLPDLSLVPEVIDKGPNAVAAAALATKTHNDKLAQLVATEQGLHPDLKIMLVDVMTTFTDIFNHPEKYGFKNVKDACYPGDFQTLLTSLNDKELKAAKSLGIDIANNPSLRVAYAASMKLGNLVPCDKPEDYLFWDHIHPTENAHKIVSNMIVKTLQENGITGPNKNAI